MKFEAVIKVVYGVSPGEAQEAYGTSDPEKMAEIDREEFRGSPESLLALVGSEDLTVTVRPVS